MSGRCTHAYCGWVVYCGGTGRTQYWHRYPGAQVAIALPCSRTLVLGPWLKPKSLPGQTFSSTGIDFGIVGNGASLWPISLADQFYLQFNFLPTEAAVKDKGRGTPVTSSFVCSASSRRSKSFSFFLSSCTEQGGCTLMAAPHVTKKAVLPHFGCLERLNKK